MGFSSKFMCCAWKRHFELLILKIPNSMDYDFVGIFIYKKKETSESPVFVTITIVCYIICAFACNLSITVTFDTRVEWDFTAQFSKQIFDSSCKLNVRQQLSLPFHKMTYKKRNNPYGLNYTWLEYKKI